MQVLNAWMVAFGASCLQISVGFGRRAWVTISEFRGGVQILGLSTELALMFSGIIIGTHMKLSDAWVMSLDVGYLQISADFGRHAWVTISDFHGAM